MKIKFIKKHNKYNAGDVADVPQDRAKYWVMVGAAEYAKEVKEDKSQRQTKELKSKPKTK